MGGEARFLRQDVIVEPLVDGFYAWLHTVAPVQAAMNLAFLQLPLLESYLQSPQVHLNASANPGMRGEFFVQVPEARAGEVRDLVASVKRDRAGMLRLASAVAEAEEIVRQDATGFDLAPLYGRLPTELAGLVEIAYDANNQAQLRYMEPVVYTTGAFDRSRQSVQVSVDPRSERPFILSTPRLGGPGVLDVRVPFDHPGLAEMFCARFVPVEVARLAEWLELGGAQADLLGEFTVPEPDLAADRHVDAGARIRYFGHACLVLQTAQAALVTDPFISADTAAGDRFTYRDLPDWIDLVLVTHGHQDHIVLETMLALRGRVGAVVVPRSGRGSLCDPSLALYLEHVGMPVVEVDDFGEVEFPGGTVIATPFLGEHASLDIRAKSTYCVRLGGRTVFVGADSSGIDPATYRHVKSHVGPVDMAFLGMECAGAPLTWLYQALLTQPVAKRMRDSRTLSGSNAAQAAAIITELGAAEAYIYAMGKESWLGHIMATTYLEDSYQLEQVAEFLGWCAERDVKAGHLLGRHEWRWQI
jgi:L-ascorbate metabolism protein UlaG (beta-lactamase superfamily)